MSTPIIAPDSSQYATFGRYVAGLVGSSGELNGGDLVEAISEAGANLLRVPLDGGEAMLQFWRAEADRAGVELDFEDICGEDGCYASLDDGEGSDGFCGTHADQRYCDTCEESFPTREDRDDHDCDA